MKSAGVTTGMTCLDVGCGAGHVSRCLATLVGPTGHVVGLDFDAHKAATARREADRAGLQNLEFRETDVTLWTETGGYDVVYGRFIVSHLADRPAFIGRLHDALRTPGTLILEDIDFSGTFCYPPNASFARYCDLYAQVVARRGGDASAGAQLYELCLGAGFDDVQVQVVQPTHGGSRPEKGLTLSTMVNFAEALLGEGLATEQEVQETIAGLTALTDDVRTIVACPRIFQVWAQRNPAGKA